MNEMTIKDFFEKVYPLLLDRTIERADKVLEDGTLVKAYWVNKIIRVDIEP